MTAKRKKSAAPKQTPPAAAKQPAAAKKPAAPRKPRNKVAHPGDPVVTVQYSNPGAQRVFIAGSFNDWHPGATEMIRLEDGSWVKQLSLKAGRYEYRLVVDGDWIEDPGARESSSNPFGGRNSILVVGG